MKKVLLFIGLSLFIVGIFLIITYFLNRDSGKGALQVTSVPKSRVYLDGKNIGETPLCKCDDFKEMITVGTHTVKLIPLSGNYRSFEEKITITSGVLTVIDRIFGEGAFSSGSIISLTKIRDKNDAQVSIISFPDKTFVNLDNSNTPSGMTPLLLKGITESDHELKIAKEGYAEKNLRIRALKGHRLEAVVFLAVSENTSSSAIPTITPSITPSISPTTIKQVIILQTPTGFLRVREDASLSSLQISQVNPGEKYELISEETGWYQIKLSGGILGWISSQYAQVED